MPDDASPTFPGGETSVSLFDYIRVGLGNMASHAAGAAAALGSLSSAAGQATAAVAAAGSAIETTTEQLGDMAVAGAAAATCVGAVAGNLGSSSNIKFAGPTSQSTLSISPKMRRIDEGAGDLIGPDGLPVQKVGDPKDLAAFLAWYRAHRNEPK